MTRSAPTSRLAVAAAQVLGVDKQGDREPHQLRRELSEHLLIYHWITSSARNSSDCEIVMPSAFAVLRLITS